MEKIRIKVNEAIAYAQKTKPLKKKDLAMKIWPGSTEHSASTNLTNLNSGRSKTVSADTIATICKETGVTADFLFGLDEAPTRVADLAYRKQELMEYAIALNDMVGDLHESIENL